MPRAHRPRFLFHSFPFPGSIMSSTPAPSTSCSNLDSIFSSAFQAYKKKTGKDITTLPLAAEIESCHSPDAILAVLRSQISALDQPQSDEGGSTKWLVPTVNVLYSLSAAVGEGVGLVNAISLSRKLVLIFSLRRSRRQKSFLRELVFSFWSGTLLISLQSLF